MEYYFTVLQGGGEDFSSITEAVNAVPYDSDAVIYIKNGIYREKLFIEKKNISLIGEDPAKTIITWQDGAFFQHPDGKKFGTFRSYTVFLSGEKIFLKNLTIRNDAGNGETAGQAIAVYADADFARFDHVTITSCQDTVFLAPLPERPRTAGSFIGPRENSPRKCCKDYFENCRISGDIDFIFGGAEAVFNQCTLISLNKNKSINGYITAASTPEGQKYGFIFYRCNLISDCPAGTVYLGRPWREFANVAFLKCHMDRHISGEGWSLWTPDSNEKNTVNFSEYANEGPGSFGNRVTWAKFLTEQSANKYIDEVNALSQIE